MEVKVSEMEYEKYKLSYKEIMLIVVISAFIIGCISYLFYRSFIVIIFLSPLSILIYKSRKKQLINKRLKELNLQFKDCILSISASLTTGYSIENSLKESYKEMKILYGERSLIGIELINMIRQVDVNIPIEKVFFDFAKRTDLEDVKLFVSVFQIAKKGGGDLTKVIKSTANNISQKIEVKKEIDTLISGKRYEQTLMNIIPMLIILYINYSSPELLKPLYKNLLGVIIMTACLIVYVFAYCLSKTIVNIEV